MEEHNRSTSQSKATGYDNEGPAAVQNQLRKKNVAQSKSKETGSCSLAQENNSGGNSQDTLVMETDLDGFTRIP